MGAEQHVRDAYGYMEPGKEALRAFAREHGHIRVLIGFARGEESRVPRPPRPPKPVLPGMEKIVREPRAPGSERWRKESITLAFPLIDLGMDRADCQAYTASVGDVTPFPSQCIACHWKGPIEILWTARQFPEAFGEWVVAEKRKIDKWGDESYRKTKQKPEDFKPNPVFKNVGVNGKGEFRNGRFEPVTLLDTLREAERTYGHLSIDELREHIFSRGHCIKSRLAA